MNVLEFILAMVITVCLSFIAMSYIVMKYDKDNKK